MSTPTYEMYHHHGANVMVRKDLRGKHREHCLCYSCDRFDISSREANCPASNIVYSVCVKYNLVLPVWECPMFIPEVLINQIAEDDSEGNDS